MKITLCGSIAFYDEMLDVKKKLEQIGHEIKLPPIEIKDDSGKMIPVKEYYAKRKAETKDTGWIWDRKEEAIRLHFEKIEWSDVILVLNYDKNNIPNYVGGNTLVEMGLAFHLKKPIFLFNAIPEISYKEEILGMKPILINQNLYRIPI
ncbi:hypothetical protein IT397_01740 [Candidatus Nomurabacteria bacterium]|nr:hypothetical protein [Candidatus Nomurabacteria bacterium]